PVRRQQQCTYIILIFGIKNEEHTSRNIYHQLVTNNDPPPRSHFKYQKPKNYAGANQCNKTTRGSPNTGLFDCLVESIKCAETSCFHHCCRIQGIFANFWRRGLKFAPPNQGRLQLERPWRPVLQYFIER